MLLRIVIQLRDGSDPEAMFSVVAAFAPSPADGRESDSGPEVVGGEIFCTPQPDLPQAVVFLLRLTLHEVNEHSSVYEEARVLPDPALHNVQFAIVIWPEQAVTHKIAVATDSGQITTFVRTDESRPRQEADFVAVFWVSGSCEQNVLLLFILRQVVSE